MSLNYTDSHSTFQLDFSIKINDSKRKSPSEFIAKLHYKSNAYHSKSEIIKETNTLRIIVIARLPNNKLI
jgi:hypothetical protein